MSPRTWTPLLTMPLYPEYTSGHGGYAGAAQAVLTAFLGRVAPAPVSATSPTDPGSTHTYTNGAEITQEVINARVGRHPLPILGRHRCPCRDRGRRLRPASSRRDRALIGFSPIGGG